MFARKLTEGELRPPSTIAGGQVNQARSTTIHGKLFAPGGESSHAASLGAIGVTVYRGAAAAGQALELARMNNQPPPPPQGDDLDSRLRRLGIRLT
jgi:hypothetical protein